jgi:fibronectin-binding autotransporter adhesin
VLVGPNTYAGALTIDSSSASANDGMTVIANNAAIANILAAAGFPYITIGDNNGGSSTLGLNGSSGSITVNPDISLAGRNVGVQAIENIAGTNTIAGNITLAVGGTFYILQCDSGLLSLTAPLPYTTPSSSGRIFTFQGPGSFYVTGGIMDGATNGLTNVWDGIVEEGPGTLTLSGPNTYSGSTTVSNGVLILQSSISSLQGVTVAGGLLVGNSSIAGPVTVIGGSIEAGTPSAIGTMSLANTLSLSGNTIVKINKSTSSSDLFSGQTSVTYGGTLTVTNLAGTLALGDHFTLFSPGTSASTFTSILGSPPGPGLAYSFANGVLSVVNGPAANPTNITYSVRGNVLTLSWPTDHLGWTLETQTNSLSTGLSTNWVRVAGSASVTSTNITISPSVPTAFYRLVYP